MAVRDQKRGVPNNMRLTPWQYLHHFSPFNCECKLVSFWVMFLYLFQQRTLISFGKV
jgi:hypothetical protein